MKLRLRYVIIFALGMIVMYALIAGNVIQTPATKLPLYMTTTDTGTSIDTNSTRVDDPMMTGNDDTSGVQITTTTGDMTTGSTIDTGVIISGDTSVEDIVAVFEWSGQEVVVETPPIETSIGNTNVATQTKTKACTQPDGTYPNPLSVFWSDTVTASTNGYLKHNGVLHYIVNVSNGTKFYYYYVCNTALGTQVKNLTNTKITKTVLSNGQVILQ